MARFGARLIVVTFEPHPLTVLRAVVVPLALVGLWVPGLWLALALSDGLRADPLLNPGGPPAWASAAVVLAYLALGAGLLAWGALRAIEGLLPLPEELECLGQHLAADLAVPHPRGGSRPLRRRAC